MSYDMHITRKKTWLADLGPRISLEEWLAYVALDPEIDQDPDNDAEDFLYSAHPDGPWGLWWNARGEIMTSRVDDAILRKLIAIAAALGARVLGDDNEHYVSVELDPIPAS